MSRTLGNLLILTLMLLFGVAGCGNMVQMERDKLRYAAMTRGAEEYKIDGKDSLVAAEERATKSVDDYAKHMQVYQGIYDYFNEKEEVLREQKKLAEENAALREELRSKGEQSGKAAARTQKAGAKKEVPIQKAPSVPEIKMMPMLPNIDSQQSTPFKTTAAEAKLKLSEPFLFWPKSIGEILGNPNTTTIVKDTKNKTETTTKITPFAHTHPEELIRALSSTASMGQIRDLITEPEIPELLPTSRTVSLGCLPPPDSAAFEAATKLAANLEKDGAGKLGVSSEYADKVVKLFEESERTMFLQYALFRLCEMSINSPSGFRNVFPVIMHDMVRRSAELRDVATKEAETRRAEEERTKQKTEETKQKEFDLKAVRQKAYLECLASKKGADEKLYSDETAAACKKQVTMDLSKKD